MPNPQKAKPHPQKLPLSKNFSLGKHSWTPWFFTGLTLAFLFRLAFGLCSEIWFIDQQQIYLIGLKYYCTGLWPYFGPDVSSHIQLPGALQGLVVGLPLYLYPIPESPYILLNLLSFSGLCLFAWYCCQRLPNFPRWIIWAWLLTAPWVLAWSTNIDNDSYVLFGSCLFFVGFLEALPPLSLSLIPLPFAGAMMGFGLFWNAQFHMSYVILFPFALAALAWRSRTLQKGTLKWSQFAAAFLLGGLLPELFVIPTYIKYGLAQGSGGTTNAIAFNPENFSAVLTVLFRFLSLACCEIPRFIGAHTADRLDFLRENRVLAPFAIIAGVLGLVQTAVLFFSGFRQKNFQKDWHRVRFLALCTFLLIYFSFLFAIKTPAAHTYFLTLPIAMLYGFYCFTPWTSRPWFLNTAKVLLICNILFQAGLALHNLPVKSLYKNRDLLTEAIQAKNYHLLAERRPDTLY